MSTDLRLRLHNAGTGEWVRRARFARTDETRDEMLRVSQLCIEALDEIERLDADAACERAEKESLKLEVERLRARVQELGVILSAWGISGWESPADVPACNCATTAEPLQYRSNNCPKLGPRND